jgi:hypothetical protein
VDVGVNFGRVDIFWPSGDEKVYVHRVPIDMRTGRNGLAALVGEECGGLDDPPAARSQRDPIHEQDTTAIEDLLATASLVGAPESAVGFVLWRGRQSAQDAVDNRRRLHALTQRPGTGVGRRLAERFFVLARESAAMPDSPRGGDIG